MKNTTIWAIIIIIVFLGVFFSLTSFYTVDQTQQAIVLRFGQIKNVKTDPGIYLKVPFVDNVVKLDKRYMIYDIAPERVITADKKTIISDTYAIWRIVEPQKFIETLRTVEVALNRLDDIVYSHVRDVIAKYTFEEILSKKRLEILDEIKNRSKSSLESFGIEIVDVRVKRTDLPPENAQAVYERMNAERYSIAAQIRAEGEREAQKMRAEADRQASMIISEAKKEAEIIRGTAEASSTAIYSQSYSLDEDFFELQRITNIYINSFEDSILFIPTDSPLLKYFYEIE